MPRASLSYITPIAVPAESTEPEDVSMYPFTEAITEVITAAAVTAAVMVAAVVSAAVMAAEAVAAEVAAAVTKRPARTESNYKSAIVIKQQILPASYSQVGFFHILRFRIIKCHLLVTGGC